MDISSKNKKLCLEPLRGIVTQGEKLADTVTFRLPNVYGNLTLSALSWQLRAASEKNTLATADLTASASGEFCLVQWEVSADFTAVSGALSLMLVGTDSEGNVVIKFPGDDPIWVRDAETGQYSPPEDAIQKALNGLQQAESALEDATKALQEIGINFKTLGHYGTLPELEAAVTSPNPGDAYGVGDPTVVYVWNGTSWAPLPGVFQPYPHTNLLVNPRFKYNSRGQSTYTGSVWTVDGWSSDASTTNISISNDGILVSVENQPINTQWVLNQQLKNYNEIAGKTLTVSLAVKVQSGSVNIRFYDGVTTSISNNADSSDMTIITATGTVSSNATQLTVIILNQTQDCEFVPVAAKLELGSVSTLQAELDNPPPEDVEKLKLDMYSLDPGRCAYLPWHNKNLLDNWYFVGGGSQQGGGQFPINQRGETSYTVSSGTEYGIDRWSLDRGTFTLNQDSIAVTGESGSVPIIRQRLENPNAFRRKRLTFSVLVKSATNNTINIYIRYNNYVNVVSTTFNNVNDGDLLVVSGTVPDVELTALFVQVSIPTNGSNFSLYSAKLELGYLSTLARKDEEGNWVLNDPPPNFQQELAKCQRYQCILNSAKLVNRTIGLTFTTGDGNSYAICYSPVPMRTTPSVSVYGSWKMTGKNTIAVESLSMSNFTDNLCKLLISASGETPGYCYSLQSDSSNSYIILDANL